MTEKKFEAWGAGAKRVADLRAAQELAYLTLDGRSPTTRLDIPENPFIEEIKKANSVLDVGCGACRNLDWIMDNTYAKYYGFDPNPSMLAAGRQYAAKYEDRVYLSDHIDEEIKSHKYDLILTTFVLQHFGYRPPEGIWNVADLGLEVKALLKEGGIWFLFEHEYEEVWQERWFKDIDMQPTVYIKNYPGLPELNDRGMWHHLIIMKK